MTAKETTKERILQSIHEKQSWRTEKENLFLIDYFSESDIPFCYECGDWHKPELEHSTTDQDEK